MAQKLAAPNTDQNLRDIQDELYRISKEAHDKGERPAFEGLLELMMAPATIITAIHNIKANKGSRTPGTDGETMRTDYLERPAEEIIPKIQEQFKRCDPKPIRRKYIDKPGKKEKRGLGIPAIRDRIVQECVRLILEPILEAQFFPHSYGFRPMRDTAMALTRVEKLVFNTGYRWVVEGDISKCFDKINHTRLLRRLYHMGIKDRRVLMIVKAFLKAGVMGECEVNELGVAQGSIIGPLLCNTYLDIMDEWVAKQWENKRVFKRYVPNSPHAKVRQLGSLQSRKLMKQSRLVPAFLVRYADDFCLVTDSKEHAEFWKKALQEFLEEELKLTLSMEKTLITDIRRHPIKFLGFELKFVKGKSRRGYVPRSRPDRKRLQRKVGEIIERIKRIPDSWKIERVVAEINLINSQIRGLIEYYQCCTWVYVALEKYQFRLWWAERRVLRKHGGILVRANELTNLPRVHENYTTKVPSVRYGDLVIGFTSIGFCKWTQAYGKDQLETPYTDQGRSKYQKRTGKRMAMARQDEAFAPLDLMSTARAPQSRFNNLEYVMNRAYALNRDKYKCKVCGKGLLGANPVTLRKNPSLPLNQINRVKNLVSLHFGCYLAVINPDFDIQGYERNAQRKIEGFRKYRIPQP